MRDTRALLSIITGALLLTAAKPSPVLTLTATAGAKRYTGSGSGQCGRETQASLYDKPATLYLVEYAGRGSGDLTRVHLALWRFKDGSPDQLALSFDAGRDSYSISTLQQGQPVGRGSATVLPAGAGGKIVAAAYDARGIPIQMTIECLAFGGIEAEGG